MALVLEGGRAEGPREAVPAEVDHKLTLVLPAAVVHELRTRMAAEGTTIRALVLEALRGAGYGVPLGEIRDRRRPEGR